MPYKSVAGGVLVGAAALVLAACGSSSSNSSSATSPASQAPAAPAAQAPAQPSSAAGPTVKTSTVAKFGTILTNSAGLSLYTASGDGMNKDNCTGTCATFWPPLLLSAGQTQPVAGAGVTGLGVIKIAAGEQVTWNGKPLYTWMSDMAPGQVTGNGVTDTDGTWQVATVGGASPSTPAAPAAPAAPASAPPTTTAPSPGGAAF